MKRQRRLFLARAAMTLLLAVLTAATAWADVTISTAAEWNTFATNVTNGTSYSGQTVKLTANIGTAQDPIMTMAGDASHKFQGTFLGGGHTMTVNYGSDSEFLDEDYIAPFRYTENANIYNLHVDGTIYTKHAHTAGLIGLCSGTTNVKNCRSSVTINSIVNGDGTHSGFVACTWNGSTTNFTNCLFDGSIKFVGTGTATSDCGGFVGWKNANVNVTNCLFAPSDVSTLGSGCYTFSRTGYTSLSNSYYAVTLDQNQGTAKGSMTNAELATALGDGWTVSGDNVVPIMDSKYLGTATIMGLQSTYIYTDVFPTIEYTVIDAEGNTLVEGTHYVVAIEDSKGQSVKTVTDDGVYTIIFAGIGDYRGQRVYNFAVANLPEGLSVDNSYNYGDAGFFYVNIPASGTKNITIPSSFKSSFKVYDDGGKGQASVIANGNLLVTVPEEYFIRLEGQYAILNKASVTVYNGNTDNSPKLIDIPLNNGTNQSWHNIATKSSTGRYLLFNFTSTEPPRSNGVDFTLTPYLPTKLDVTVNNPGNGCTVTSDKEKAAAGETVTLTINPAEGYMISNLTIKDADNHDVTFTNGHWYSSTNIVTFVMPSKDVTITPTFTNNLTAEGGLFVNMPKEGDLPFTIPAGVTSFKVYDDGGATGNSTGSNGTLTMTTTQTGKVLYLTGNVATWEDGDMSYLTVYNSDGTTTLVDQLKSTQRNTPVSVGEIISKGQSMKLYFKSHSLYQSVGLDLTVAVYDPNGTHSITVNNPKTGGTVTPSKNDAFFDETITLTANPDENYILDYVNVVDGNSDAVSVTGFGNAWYKHTGNTATFQMPATNVTATPTFIASTGLYINMEYEKTVDVNIPEGVRSVKVYDNGGANSTYRDYSDDYVILTAPAGRRLKVTGSVQNSTSLSDENDYLAIYDSDGTTELLKVTKANNGEITPCVSNGQSIKLYYHSDGSGYSSGLNLTVTVLPKITVNKDDGIQHLAFASVYPSNSFSDDFTSAEPGTTVYVRYVTKNGYNLGQLTVKQGDTNLQLSAIGGNDWDDHSFVMPDGDVVVTGTTTSLGYTITYDGAVNGVNGVTNPNPTTYTTEDEITLVPATRSGYDCYWYQDSERKIALESTPITPGTTGNKTFYAKWVAKEYHISYYLQGGHFESYNYPLIYTIESDDITIPVPVRSGYVFLGWTWEGQTTPVEEVVISKGSVGDRTYNAVWGIPMMDTTISFSENNYTYDAVQYTPEVTVSYGGVTLTENTHYTLTMPEGRTDAGTYIVTVTALANTGYYGSATKSFKINPRPVDVTVTGETVEKVYDGQTYTADEYEVESSDPRYTKDDFTVLVNQAFASNVGTMSMDIIPPSNLNNNFNPNFNLIPGWVKIKPRPLSITAEDKEKYCGQVDPELTVTFDGLVDESHKNHISYSISRVAGETEGTYAITPTGAESQYEGNYQITFVPGTLTIKPTVTLATEGYGTCYFSQYVATLPAGMKARIVTAEDNGTLTYETIADGDGDIKTIPAGTAVMLQTTEGTSAGNLTLSTTDIDDRDFSATNLLHGSDVATMTTGGAKFYKLSYDTNGANIGWYWGAEGGEAFQSGAHKAWLALGSANARAFFNLPGFGETEGISSLTLSPFANGEGSIYTLDGRKLDGTPTAKGLYIINGKKVVIK